MVLKKSIKKVIVFLMTLVFRLLIFIWFWFIRWVSHNKFLAGLNNKKIGGPSIFSIPFIYLNRFISFVRLRWNIEFINYGLKKYRKFLPIHYSKNGLGYFNYDKLSPAECLRIYNEQNGRISYYLKHNPAVLNYNDRDSFLDAGCGKGQNIKELISLYPNSSIKGFDVSIEVLKIIQTALKNNKNVRVEEGSVIDFKYLDSYAPKSYDHLIVSHVFSFLFSSNIEETRELRQNLIDGLVRIAAKSILIMDSNILSENNYPELIIEQNNRCVFRESLIPYFSKHASKGELYAMFSPENEAIIFKLR